MTNYRQTMAEAMEKVHLSEKEINKLRNGVKVLGNALPNRALAQQMADKANKEMGHNADVYQSPFNNRFYVRIKEDINEADDHEISMARGELEAISDKALKLSSILQGKTDKDNIEAWVQSKITKAKDYINSVADYMEYNPDMKQNEEATDKKVDVFHKKLDKLVHKSFGHSSDEKKDKKEEVELEEGVTPAMIAMLKKEYEPFRGKTITAARAKQLMNILDKFKDDDLKKLSTQNIPFISSGSKSKLVVRNMKFKVTDVKPFKEELEDYTEEQLDEMFGNRQIDPTTAAALRKYLSGRAGGAPFPPVVEGKMSQIHAMMKDGKSAAEIAKVLKLDYKTVRDILGEKVEEAVDKKEVEKKEKEKTPAVEPDVRSDGEKEVKKEDDSEKLKSELEKKDNEIAQLKVKAETEKAKNVQKQTQKMVNPETGEPLLQVGIAYKHLKDKMAKAKEKDVKEEVSKDGAYAIGMAQAKKKFNDEPPLDKKTITKGHEIAKSILKKESNEHPAKEIFEAIAVVKNKAEKTGMPYSILKQVYDRGMAAWRGGHRPGATQVQWALARVNSFVTKSSGTWGGADKDLAAKVKGSK
jgi:hypothetical protein